MEILRFLTAGSVDDGKSTLIGRLLFDSKNILVDQLEILQKQSKNVEPGDIDLALLTDGLRAEREQGITIDVAYKYFTTAKRKFIIADAPGHVQYTRNMITGASNSDAMIVLVDARHGVIEQTKRHSYIASLLSIPHIIVAINKMDLVNYAEEVFETIKTDFQAIAQKMKLPEATFIPMSALTGENIVESSHQMPWYEGPSLLRLLEHIPVDQRVENEEFQFQVQYVNRPQTLDLHDFRGYAGKVLSGEIQKGELIEIQPSGYSMYIKSILHKGVEISHAKKGMVCTLELTDDVDISRGDLIVKSTKSIVVIHECEAMMCWMSEIPLRIGGKYLLQQNSSISKAIIQEVVYKMDIHSFEPQSAPEKVQLNDIVKIKLITQRPIMFSKGINHPLNKGILVDETTHNTVGAFIIPS